VATCRQCGSNDIEDTGVTNPEPWWVKPEWLENIEAYKQDRNVEKIRVTRLAKALSVAIPGDAHDPMIRAQKKDVLALGALYRVMVFGEGGAKPCGDKYNLSAYPWLTSAKFKPYWEQYKPAWYQDAWIPEGFWTEWGEA
jgi:hypothetical protein